MEAFMIRGGRPAILFQPGLGSHILRKATIANKQPLCIPSGPQYDAITIFVTMFVLSIVPGPSIFLVIARSMTSSLGRGLVTIWGIVLANFIFILLAVFGVGALVASMDGLFTMLKYAGSGYLFWLGIKLLLAQAKESTFDDLENASWSSNFAAGFVITISAPRAILFLRQLAAQLHRFEQDTGFRYYFANARSRFRSRGGETSLCITRLQILTLSEERKNKENHECHRRGCDDYHCPRRRTQTLKNAHICLLSAMWVNPQRLEVQEHDGLLEQPRRGTFQV